MNSYTRVALGLFAIIFFASCGVGKKPVRKNVRIDKNKITQRYGPNGVDTVSGAPSSYTTKEPKPILNDKKKELINNLMPVWQRELKYSSFSGKAKMHYQARGQKQEFTAHIRINKNKMIWVNITALGGVVNVARALITPDSIFMVNYLQKEAYRMPVSEANKLLPAPVDFDILQNLIVGNALKKQGKPTDATDFGGTLSLQVEDGNIIQNVSYNKTDSSMRSLQILSKDQKGPTGMIQYGNYDIIDGRNFSGSRVININNNGEPYYLDMNFGNVDFDKALEFPFSIPKNYTVK
jgi:hypothetical protein